MKSISSTLKEVVLDEILCFESEGVYAAAASTLRLGRGLR